MSNRSKPKPGNGAWLLFALASSAPSPLSLRALALFLLFALAGVGLGDSLLGVGVGGIECPLGIEDMLRDGLADRIQASALATFEHLLLGSGFLVLLQQRRHSLCIVFSGLDGDRLLGLCLFLFRREGPS